MSAFSENKRLLRRLFKPGTVWKRTNRQFPQRCGDGTVLPIGTTLLARVHKQHKDAIEFELGPPLPYGHFSYLSYPTEGTLRLELHHIVDTPGQGGLRVFSHDQLLLTYEPTNEPFPKSDAERLAEARH